MGVTSFLWQISGVLLVLLTQCLAIPLNASSPACLLCLTREDIRLPRFLRPTHYDLTLKTYLPSYVKFHPHKDFTFDGEVVITLDVLDPTPAIVLNMKDIKVHKDKSHLDVDGDKIDIVYVLRQDKLEKVQIVPAKPLQKGKPAKLTLVYRGIIRKPLKGLYQTRYHDPDGTEKVAAVTHMEPTFARYVVPCFDEPEYKAPWGVKVIHPKGTIARSNGMEEKEEEDPDTNWVTTHFKETPKMPSYLLAVTVSEFDFVPKKTKNDVLFRLWARNDLKKLGDYALDAGVKCMDYYEKLYKFPFPLKKEDMFALPDLSWDAMENWGLVTYREPSLLYDPRFYKPADKRWIADTVAHELAHQWFGNLVTPKWWNDLWLNEGFATYNEYLGADAISDGKYRMKDYFVVDALRKAMARDSVSSSHPLSFKVDTTPQIYEAFDPISYDKGASVIRMMSNILGEDNFNKGVAHYIGKYNYSNADSNDLWNTMGEVVSEVPGPEGDLNLTNYADQWTTQMGFPLINVEPENATHVKLTQERYRRNPKSADPEKYSRPKYEYKWDVPIWHQKGKEPVELAWLPREEPLYLELSDPEQPLVINADRKGYYRQNHDTKGWEKIAKQLKDDHKVYSAPTRNGIISDAFAAALIDKIPYETVFDLLGYIKNEEDYLPWDEALDGFFNVLGFLGNGPEAEPAKKYMLNLMKPAYEKCNFDTISKDYTNDDKLYDVLRDQAIMDAYCRLGNEDCIKKYKELFDKEVVSKCENEDANVTLASECVSIAAPLREPAYCYGIKEGNEAAYQKVMDLYLVEDVQLEKAALRRALTCTKDVKALNELMTMALDRNSTFARVQDVVEIFRSVSKNPEGQQAAFKFLIDHWDLVYDGMYGEHKAIGDIVSAVSVGVRTNEDIEKLRNLKKNGKHAEEFAVFDEVIEKADQKVEWIGKHSQGLVDYFKKSE